MSKSHRNGAILKMKIQKLTITPVSKDFPYSYTTIKPTVEEATQLISDKLRFAESQCGDEKPAKYLRRLKKCLKGFVDPKTLVVKERKFDVNA